MGAPAIFGVVVEFDIRRLLVRRLHRGIDRGSFARETNLPMRLWKLERFDELCKIGRCLDGKAPKQDCTI